MDFDGKDGRLKLSDNNFGYSKYDIWVFVRLQEKSCPDLSLFRPPNSNAHLAGVHLKDRMMVALLFVKFTE